jgi:hypothetical protein
MKKSLERFITALVIIAVLVLSMIIILNKQTGQTSTDIAKCIGQNSVVYVQTGCSHCKDQEDLFGNNTQYLTMVDCLQADNMQKCVSAGIQGTPTWIIKNQSYEGVQTVEKLKQLTGC